MEASPQEIQAAVERLQNEAMSGCGSVYELYARRFSQALDAVVPPEDPRRAVALACAGGDYFTPEELRAGMEAAEAEGLCRHGLNPDCCPAGCGG